MVPPAEFVVRITENRQTFLGLRYNGRGFNQKMLTNDSRGVWHRSGEMRTSTTRTAVIGCFLISATLSLMGQPPVLVQGSLSALGVEPFFLKATITEGGDTSPKAEVEIEWVAPDKWRRTITSDEFAQTLIVNGDKVFDRHSDNYFPLFLDTLVTAMIYPAKILAAYQPGDRLQTKANGASSESGSVCYDEKHTICMHTPFGLTETVGVAGHSIEFTQYENFRGMRIARRLVFNVSAGDFEIAHVTTLEPLKHPDESHFAIDNPTPREGQLVAAIFNESELRSLAAEQFEIIWPQVLDGAQTGTATFYVAIDPRGRIREALPIQTANERSNDSAIRQIMRWKFKPPTRDGLAVQAEGLLTFQLNTRAFGPKDLLSDAEVRKLATNTVEPVIPPGAVPPGTEYKLWIAVDSDGIVIEKIISEGHGVDFGLVDKALLQWRFKPIMEDGQPRPYRALLVFKF